MSMSCMFCDEDVEDNLVLVVDDEGNKLGYACYVCNIPDDDYDVVDNA